MNPRDHQSMRLGCREPVVPVPRSGLPRVWRIAAVASIALFGLTLTTPVRAQTAPGTATLMQQAQAGNAAAETKLGYAYTEGLGGLPKNPVEAVNWFRKAAAQGDPQAETILGVDYANGEGGLPKNPVEALKWFRKAVEQGYAPAEYNLGVCYDNGEGGLPKNPIEAVQWYRKAAAQGDQPAIAVLQRLQHTPQQAVATTSAVAAAPPAPVVRVPTSDNQQTLQNLQRFWTLYFQASNAQVVDFGEPALVQPVSYGAKS